MNHGRLKLYQLGNLVRLLDNQKSTGQIHIHYEHTSFLPVSLPHRPFRLRHSCELTLFPYNQISPKIVSVNRAGVFLFTSSQLHNSQECNHYKPKVKNTCYIFYTYYWHINDKKNSNFVP